MGRNDLVGNQNDSAAIGIGSAGPTVLTVRSNYDVPGARFSRRLRCIPEEEDTVEGSGSNEIGSCDMLSSSSSEESKSELNDLTPLSQNDLVGSQNDGAAIGIVESAGSTIPTARNDCDVTGTRFSRQTSGDEDGSASKEVGSNDLLGSSSSEESNLESDYEERGMGGISRGTIDGDEAMDVSSSTSTEMNDYGPNSYHAGRSGDLVDELPFVDPHTGCQQGLMVQPQTALTFPVSLQLGSISTNTMLSFTESSRHSGAYNQYQ